MEAVVKNLNLTDIEAARKYAIEGMHLSWYVDNKFLLYIYSKYFIYLEMLKATRAYGAYINGSLVGVLFVNMKYEPKVFNSFFHRFFVKTISLFIRLFYGSASGIYDQANKELFQDLQRRKNLDGELNFFAVDPSLSGKGVGTLLLNQLQNDERGKHIYLFSDTGSTYQFYERRGFTTENKRDINITVNSRNVPLTCFIFSKIL